MARVILLALSIVGVLIPQSAVWARDPAVGQADDATARAIARLNVQGFGRCTASLIAPDLAVTAAHCLRHSVSGRLVAADRLHLLFEYDRGAWRAHRRVAGYRLSARRPGALSNDWALLKLAETVTDAAPLALAESRRSPRGPLTLGGYGAPRVERLGWIGDCPLRARRHGLLVIGCATSKGASGGVALDASGRLVGVISAAARVRGAPVALAAALDASRVAALLSARDGWITEPAETDVDRTPKAP